MIDTVFMFRFFSLKYHHF